MKRMTEASAMLLLAWVDGMIKKSEFTIDDDATYALLQRGDTDGIFFLESRYDKYNLQLLKPSCMAELTAACAMTHPLTCKAMRRIKNRQKRLFIQLENISIYA